MSMTLSGDGSITGLVAGGLPDASVVDADLSLAANSAPIKTALNASGSAPIYACRAWVNFNGTGTVAIRESGNVSSITDNGTGIYTVNFTAAMPDANYSVVSSSASGTLAANATYPLQAETYNTTSVQVVTRYNGASTTAAILSDILLNNVAIFR